MRLEDCYQLGYVTKTHGLKGEIQLFLDADIPEQYQNLESVFVQLDNELVPFFFEYIQISGSKVIAKVEDIDSKDDALKLVSKTLHLPLTALPKLPTGSYYYHDLVGFDFFDQGKLLGKVTSIYNMTSQNIMVVDHAGAEILVPMSDEIILNMDTTEKSVQADLPEGVIELYSTRDED